VAKFQLVPRGVDEVVREFGFDFRHVLGMTMFVVNQTRPDGTYAVNALARHASNPSNEHFVALKRIVRWLKGTRDLTLKYSASGSREIVIACDATWGDCSLTRKSVGGWVAHYGGGAISWRSWRMKSIKTSSMFAELEPVMDSGKEAVWWLKILKETEHEQKQVEILCDSQSLLMWLRNPKPSGRAKHIDISFWWIVEQLEGGWLRLSYVATTENTADALTKPLARILFKVHEDVLLGYAAFPTGVGMTA